MEVENRVVVITGAASGIGRAMAESFAAAGARVVLGDIDAVALKRVAAQIRSHGQTAVWGREDASSTTGIAALITLAEKTFGPVDIYVANAGVGGPPGLGADEKDWEHALEINLRAHVRAARQLVPVWKARGSGYFVSTASAAGLLTQVGAAAYSVTKHAAIGFAEWLAVTYGDAGIGVTCVCPMYVKTPFLDIALSSDDPAWRPTANAITVARDIVMPEAVAASTIEAVRQKRFLVLTHQEALDQFRYKANDYDEWITSMQGYRRALNSA